jgi:hypothetical protein
MDSIQEEHQMLCKSLTGTLAMIRQAFGKKAWALHGKSKLTETQKGRDRRKAKPGACSSFSLTSRRLFTNNSSWQAKQSIPHTTVTFYGDCMKMCEDFDLSFGNKRFVCCITTTCRLTLPSFTKEFFTKINMTVVLQPPYSPDFALCDFPVSSIEYKNERPPF